MSDILIKGMEMPPSCRYCEFRHMSLTQNAFCTAAQETIDYMAERTKRLDDCPLVSVPPHGRLIDADALAMSDRMVGKLMMFGGEYVYTQAEIDNAPTIIEAEWRE